ncbi:MULTISPECIES: ABC transporter permease [unclassified Arthrobacter]|uniref:ABC transporter permease n=1 Tax=unclassified Arthrobacter TaxID=235627 RepID=UPI002E0A73B9|nr:MULTISPECIES: ABC transporter permease [unclassified Arthrobacter]MEC5193333.1 ABC-2 type transport system permease protein [Arthrobacter sp. MP_M4]MEC5204799.1 ABC-2 type transport system permease protein [Arthrobacter sp. MP_M7]
MPETFAGTGVLIRLGLRRDRWMLPVWIVGFALVTYSTALAGTELYPDVTSRVEAATALNATASMVAMFGRIYDPSSIGALSLIKYTAFMTAILAVLMAVLIIRHTRGDEESGRLELLGGGRLGRDAPLAAALTIGLAANVLLGLLCAAALAAGGLPAAGSVAFGLGWAATGMAFSAVAGLAAQLTASARAATGISIGFVAITYALRAVGDLAEPGPSALSWVSPIGWNQQIRAFAGDQWWVLVLPVCLSLALIPAAFALRARRDLGSGLRAERPGPAVGSLSSVWDLAVRLQYRVLVAWAMAFLVFGVVIGSLVSNVAELLSSPNAQDVIKLLGGPQALRDAFLAAEISVMGLLAAGYGVSAANHLRSEETAGHTEALLGTATTRIRWASSHFTLALGGVALLLLLAGVSIGVGAAVAVSDPEVVGRSTAAALAQVPAAWVVTSLALVVFGWAPRLAGAVWGILLAFVALGEFGVLWNAPQWLMDLSPFRHSPLLPVDTGDAAVLMALTVAAAALTALGYVGWRRRDLEA